MQRNATFTIPVTLDLSGVHSKLEFHLVVYYDYRLSWLKILQNIHTYDEQCTNVNGIAKQIP